MPINIRKQIISRSLIYTVIFFTVSLIIDDISVISILSSLFGGIIIFTLNYILMSRKNRLHKYYEIKGDYTKLVFNVLDNRIYDIKALLTTDLDKESKQFTLTTISILIGLATLISIFGITSTKIPFTEIVKMLIILFIGFVFTLTIFIKVYFFKTSNELIFIDNSGIIIYPFNKNEKISWDKISKVTSDFEENLYVFNFHLLNKKSYNPFYLIKRLKSDFGVYTLVTRDENEASFLKEFIDSNLN